MESWSAMSSKNLRSFGPKELLTLSRKFITPMQLPSEMIGTHARDPFWFVPLLEKFGSFVTSGI
jgi:hypothetical protein